MIIICRWEKLTEGQTSLQHSTVFMVVWPDSVHSSVKTHEHTLGICTKAPKELSDCENKILWSDEPQFQALCLKETSSAHYLQSTITQVKCAGSSLMLWSCFSVAGTEGLVRVEEKLNAPKYRDSLNENPVQSIQNLRLDRRFTFQEDNGPKHTARVAYRQLWSELKRTQWNISGETWKCLPAPIQPDRAWKGKRSGEEWQIIAKRRCAKLVASYQKDLRL